MADTGSAGEDDSALVIGAGPAGLAAAHALKEAGLRPRIIDAAHTVASAWRSRHEDLRLNTHRWLSHQPGVRMPRRLGAFPARDDYIDYLEQYARGLDLPIELGVEALRIERKGDNWSVRTHARAMEAKDVIVATGSDRVPHTPPWPGLDAYRGELIHAARFRRAADYAGKRVLIVGAGNSAVDLGNHLARAGVGPSWISVRHGATIAPMRMLGVPSHLIANALRWLPPSWQEFNMALVSRLFLGDLRRLGLPAPPHGALTRHRLDGVTVAVDDGFVAALRQGRFSVVAPIESFEPDAVRLVDGSRLQPDAVICATGYRLGLEALVGHLGVLDGRGHPVCNDRREAIDAKRLWFFGHNASIHGNMNVRRHEARRLAEGIASRR